MFPNQKRKGHIFRISEDDWERQVFKQKKYYTGMSIGWKLETSFYL